MGCCNSTEAASPYSNNPPRPADPTSPAAHASLPPDSSRAAIVQPSRSVSNADSRTSSVAQNVPAPSSRPNVAIRAPSPVPQSPAHLSHRPPPWTRRQLEQERAAFFDTRVAGRSEMWSAMRLVADMLRGGDVLGAQGVLDAVNATCPNGRVAGGRGRNREKGGVYDERGELYDVPAWVIVAPEDVVEDEEKDAEREEEEEGEDGDGEETPETLAARERRRDEKGKGRAEDVGELLRVRARLSDRGSDVLVQIGGKEKVSVLVRRIQEQIAGKRLRLAYLGKIMDEGKTLEQNGWKLGHVLNALVFEGDEKMLAKKGAT